MERAPFESNTVGISAAASGAAQALAPLDWDPDAVDALARADNVWIVQVTDGRGHSVRQVCRREGYEGASEVSASLDVALHAVATCGERLHFGELELSAQIFSGGLLVAARGPSGAAVSALASPHANLGQLLNHLRRILASFNAGVML
jgi:hypothetical protein